MKKMSFLLIIIVLFQLLMVSATPAFQGSDPAGDQATKTTPKKVKANTNAATDDASITAAIKEKFAAAHSTKNATIDIAVKDGVVTLTGKVKSGPQKGSATRMAQAVPGVKSVDNLLEVEGTVISKSKK